MAGLRSEFDVQDADGRRRVVLQAVVPGRRYLIGKGEGCDIRVNGTYTSRRHAEIWLDRGGWWVADAGSTNGIRVESQTGPQGRSGAAIGADVEPPVRLTEDALIVLSARAEGPPVDYPTSRCGRSHGIGVGAPDADRRGGGTPKTPLTAILPARERRAGLQDHRSTGHRRAHARAEQRECCRSRSAARATRRWSSIGATTASRAITSTSSGSTTTAPIWSCTATTASRSTACSMRPVRAAAGTSAQTLLLGAAAEGPAACTLQLTRQAH